MSENLPHFETGGERGARSAAEPSEPQDGPRRWGRAAPPMHIPDDQRRSPAASPTLESIKPSVQSETGQLREVIIGYPDSFVLPTPINRKQEIFHDRADRPTAESLKPEFQDFRLALEERGVIVHQPRTIPGVPDQLTPRDIGFVIGETFVIARMASASRHDEWIGIRHLIDRMPDDQVILAPANAIIEGGDVILDRGVLFIGVGQRTNDAGASFLREHFGASHDVVTVPLKALDDDEDVLHLDCAFVPVGESHALIYPEGLNRIPDVIRDRYDWIEIDREEQFELGTNVLSISRNELISRTVCPRINAELSELGFDVIEIAFDGTPKSGGSFRCASLPLVRDA